MSSKEFDTTFKDLIEMDPACWPAAFGFTDVKRVDFVDADVSTVMAAADKVLRVESDWGVWLMDLEPESGHAADAPGRMHLYSTVLHQRHGLFVRSVLLLLRPEANASNLTGELQLRFPGEEMPYDVFRYQVVRLWQLPMAPFLAGGLGTLPLAALTDEAKGNLAGAITQIEERVKGASRERAAKVLASTFILLGLRYSDELIATFYKGEATMEDSSTYQLIMARSAKQMLIELGTDKFGAPDQAILLKLDAIKDASRLRKLGIRLLHVSSWEELLADNP